MNLHFLFISQLKKKKTSYCDLTEIGLTGNCEFLRDHDAQQENNAHIEETIDSLFSHKWEVEIYIFFQRGTHCNLF